MKRTAFIGLAVVMAMSLLVAVAVAGPADTNMNNPFQTYPTATLLPTDDLEFTVEQVEADGEPIIFEDQTIDGFTFEDITYQTLYPLGLEFTFKITPPEGTTLETVNARYEFSGGSRGRVPAERIDDEGTFRAVAFEGGGLAPWQVMDVMFSATASDGSGAETEPVHIQYADPTRPWWRAESQDAIIYWFDFPEELGEVTLKAVAAVRDKYEQGFGGLLSYKPRVIIFPPGDVWGEWRGGQGNDRTTGQASNTTQSAVLRVRGLEIEDIRENCVWNEPRDVNWQMEFAASVTTHEIAHLYQYDFFNGQGPAWWIEGQATFFEKDSGPFDERMKALALYQDLPTLQGQGPSGMVGTPASDGCTHLGYEMGTSFINWWVNNYGDFEAHRQVVEMMDRNVGLQEALEEISGVSFVELEQQWRAYLGLNPEPRIIATPTFNFPSFGSPTPGSNK